MNEEIISADLWFHLRKMVRVRLGEMRDTDEIMRLNQELRSNDDEMKWNALAALLDEELEGMKASHKIELDDEGVWDFVREAGS